MKNKSSPKRRLFFFCQTAIVFNDWHSRIEKHLEVPVEGLATLKKWMLENVKPEAVQKSKEKGN